MKTILLFSIFLMLSFSTFCQLETVDLRNVMGHMPEKASFGNEVSPVPFNVDRKIKIRKPSFNLQKNGDICENVIGTTTYDLQTNASVANRMISNSNGMSAVWTFSDENSNSFTDRGSGYNYFNSSDWGDFPTSRIESVRIGWPNVCVTGGGKEFVIAHTFLATGGLHISSRDMQGDGMWTETTMDGTVGQVWPRVTSGGIDNNSIHIVSISLPIAAGGTLFNGLDGALLYFRSQDEGQTWDQIEVQIPGTTDEFIGFNPDAYAISANGNKVAIAVFGDFYDSFVLISEDNGDTWTKTLLVDFPVDNYVLDTGIDLDMDGIQDTLNNTDGSGSVLVDHLGKTHVFYGDMRYLDADLGDGNFNYFPFTSGIWYWNDGMQQPVEIIDEIDTDGDPDALGYDDLGLYFNSLTGFVSSSTDPLGNLFLSFSSLREDISNGLQNYRHIYLMSSSDSGQSWSGPIDVTPELDGDETIECVYPTMAPFVSDRIQLWYQRDFEPGLSVQGDQDPLGLNEIVHLDINPSIAVFLNEPALEVNLEIYPNPTQSQIQVFSDLTFESNVDLIVVDINGKIVLIDEIVDQQHLVDMNPLNPGVYFFIFESEGKIHSEKVVLN